MNKKMSTEIFQYFQRKLWRTLFLVAAGLLFAITLSSLIRLDTVQMLQQKVSVPLQVFYAELVGFISPGPRYVMYPILIKLQDFGVNLGVIIALISGHVLIEPSTFLVEAGFFGHRFPIKRLVVSLIVTFLAGMAAAAVSEFVC